MKRFIFSIILLLATAGCKTREISTIRKLDSERPIPSIVGDFDKNVDQSLGGTSNALAKAVENEALSAEISNKTEGTTKTMADKINENSGDQKDDLSKVKTNLTNLVKQSFELKRLEAYISEINESNKGLIKERDDALKELEKKKTELSEIAQDTQRWYGTIWKFVMGFCAIGIAIGVGIIILGSAKSGITLTSGSVVLLCISFFLSQHAVIVSIIGGVLLVCFIIVMGIIQWKQRQAITETVHTVEILKETPWVNAKGKIQDIQSPSTRALVEEIKRNSKDVQTIQKERNKEAEVQAKIKEVQPPAV